MPRTRTREQIRDSARQLADQVGSTFVTDAAANFWIDQAVAELWDLLLAADPDRYLVTSNVNTTQGTKGYALPADFYKLRGVDLLVGSERYSLEPYQFAERNRYRAEAVAFPASEFSGVRYRVQRGGMTGSTGEIRFEPDPGTNTYELHYLQAPQLLTTDGATFDGVAGWEDWVVYTVAIQMMLKEESDPSGLMAERARIEQRINRMAADRDMGRAPRIQDVREYSRRNLW